jgi:hypothetical protein
MSLFLGPSISKEKAKPLTKLTLAYLRLDKKCDNLSYQREALVSFKKKLFLIKERNQLPSTLPFRASYLPKVCQVTQRHLKDEEIVLHFTSIILFIFTNSSSSSFKRRMIDESLNDVLCLSQLVSIQQQVISIHIQNESLMESICSSLRITSVFTREPLLSLHFEQSIFSLFERHPQNFCILSSSLSCLKSMTSISDTSLPSMTEMNGLSEANSSLLKAGILKLLQHSLLFFLEKSSESSSSSSSSVSRVWDPLLDGLEIAEEFCRASEEVREILVFQLDFLSICKRILEVFKDHPRIQHRTCAFLEPLARTSYKSRVLIEELGIPKFVIPPVRISSHGTFLCLIQRGHREMERLITSLPNEKKVEDKKKKKEEEGNIHRQVLRMEDSSYAFPSYLKRNSPHNISIPRFFNLWESLETSNVKHISLSCNSIILSSSPFPPSSSLFHILTQSSFSPLSLTISFPDNELDDLDSERIGLFLRTNTTLLSLHLDNNNIGDSGLKSLALALQLNNTLQYLYLLGRLG